MHYFYRVQSYEIIFKLIYIFIVFYMKITSKQEMHKAVYSRFKQLCDKGLTKTAATYKVMSEFNICTPSTVNNIRKKFEGGN